MLSRIRNRFSRSSGEDQVPALLTAHEFPVTRHQEEVLFTDDPGEGVGEPEGGDDPPPADPPPEPSVEMSAVEIFQPGAEEAVELSEEDGFITKTIMREGEWTRTPGANGISEKKLKVVKQGESDLTKGIISMEELVTNFKAPAYQYVTVPLSDTKKDHANLTKNNTGYIKDVWVEDNETGPAKLKAKFHFTEPEVKGKVERGTIPDCSAGVYFNVVRPDGKKFGSAINHVCLTKNPFMDGMEPFGLHASGDDAEDDAPSQIEGFVPTEKAEEAAGWDERLSFSWQEEQVGSALRSQLDLSDDYIVTNIAPERAIITHKVSETSWVAPFKITDSSVELAEVKDWKMQEKAEEEGSEQPDEPAPVPEQRTEPPREEQPDPLKQARGLRELRSRGNANSEGGEAMGRLATDPLEGVDMNDPDAIRERFAQLAQTNQELLASSRTGEVDAEVERVKALFAVDDDGNSEVPGFLRVYRDILLSDDQQPAAVLLSHDDSGKEVGKESVTATQIAKRLIDALPTEEKDGELKVMLSGQHLASGNDDPPPAEDESDELDNSPAAVAERTKAAAAGIGAKGFENEGTE